MLVMAFVCYRPQRSLQTNTEGQNMERSQLGDFTESPVAWGHQGDQLLNVESKWHVVERMTDMRYRFKIRKYYHCNDENFHRHRD